MTRTPHIRDVEIALRRDGTVLGWREKVIEEVGAYSGLGPSILALSEWVTVGPYRTPALDIEGCCVYTNKPPASAYRGFGNPQATFARELMFDICARTLGMDPVEFRQRNIFKPQDLPGTTANGLKLATLPIAAAMEQVVDAIGYHEFRRTKKPYQGVGVVNMIEWGGGCRWLDSLRHRHVVGDDHHERRRQPRDRKRRGGLGPGPRELCSPRSPRMSSAWNPERYASCWRTPRHPPSGSGPTRAAPG